MRQWRTVVAVATACVSAVDWVAVGLLVVTFGALLAAVSDFSISSLIFATIACCTLSAWWLLGRCSSIVNPVVRSTRVPIAELPSPTTGIRSPVFGMGRVRSESERTQAITIARRVSGVTEVKDALQVIPEGQQ